ncbi:1-acyl-sn-glycerol-3-phosphate acyltransferase, putative [Plasmodium vinckei brucechwatti]|uniref:1-acyl-sn-glycerol-3-phosphate acyltransferase, putative n=1 Tax=Plasmodium vinckei brucechwatti TaxID=119398 RepID=A0A6V7SLA7_PLAVN|nr:1-acyl-sn-glycerol-3-phosphate acyltransferase, putative [Plasmodium vinckei brucechwatti]
MEIADTNKPKKSDSFIAEILISVYISIVLVSLILIAFVFDVIAIILFFPILLYSRRFRLAIFGYSLKFFMKLVVSWINPFWNIKVLKKLKKGYNPSNSIVFSNHLSSLDAWVINYTWYKYNIKFICKGSLFKLPICGQLIALSDEIPIMFGKGKGGWEVPKEAKEKAMRLAKEFNDLHYPLMVFPEGTRSKTGKLQMFKMGFFKFAIENNMEIIPCALHGSDKLWTLSSLLFKRGTVYVSYGEPFRPTPGMTVPELAEKTRQIIFEMIKEFPDYNPNVDQISMEYTEAREQGI